MKIIDITSAKIIRICMDNNRPPKNGIWSNEGNLQNIESRKFSSSDF